MCDPEGALTRQFLEWLSSRPRTYDDVMEAWRTSCPRHTVWEDSVSAGFVSIERQDAGVRPNVVLTVKGKAALSER
jgi:hypothetical protein